MSLQANKKSIVAFVAGAAALGFAMTYSFGGREAFVKHETFLLYFDGSVSGLDDTSLVKFRGVPIGYVASLKLKYEELENDQRVPVFVKVDVDRLKRQLNLTADLGDPAVLEQQIRLGLRGKLEVDSYVTGKLYVDLGYYPDAPKPPVLAFETKEAVIPTLPSQSSQIIANIQAMTTKLGAFDFKGLEAKINDMLDEASEKVAGIPFDKYNQKLQDLLEPLSSLDPQALHAQLEAFMARLENYQQKVNVPNAEVVKQSANMLGMSANAQAGIERLHDNLKALRVSLQMNGDLRTQLDQMLLKANGMASSLRQQATALEEQPGQ